jgi:hypothetical protein
MRTHAAAILGASFWALREFRIQHTILRDPEKNVFCSLYARNRTFVEIVIGRLSTCITAPSGSYIPHFPPGRTKWPNMSIGDEGFQRPPDFRADNKIGHIIEIGRLAVENDKPGPTALRQ